MRSTMLKYILALLLLLPAQVWGGVFVGFGQSVASSPDILFHWNAENSLNADKGSVTMTNSGSVFSSTAQVGTYSFSKDGNYDGGSFTITSSHFEPGDGQFGLWLYTSNGYQAANTNRIVRIGDGGNNTLTISLLSSGIRAAWIGNANQSNADMTTAISTSTWYYIVVKWIPGDAGNDLTLTVYDTGGSTVGTATVATITAMNAAPNSITFWNSVGDAVRANVDNLIISNDTTRDMWAVRNGTSF